MARAQEGQSSPATTSVVPGFFYPRGVSRFRENHALRFAVERGGAGAKNSPTPVAGPRVRECAPAGGLPDDNVHQLRAMIRP
jgi:hypothetical protein